MSEDLFRYDLMVEDALRGVVRDSLKRAANMGLPGNHHFYITFKTAAPGVDIPSYLKDRYPDEMTIVLQYQFWDLRIDDEKFEVTLSFNDVRERLVVPFMGMTGFADPSVQFGLQFQPRGDDDEEGEPAPTAAASPAAGGEQDDKPDGDDDPGGGEVVSLDQFRKKK